MLYLLSHLYKTTTLTSDQLLEQMVKWTFMLFGYVNPKPGSSWTLKFSEEFTVDAIQCQCCYVIHSGIVAL